MSEWISVEEAAKKYNLKKEYIQLWVDMRVIMSWLTRNFLGVTICSFL